jgi:DNA-binding NarL/FixJ family response regulator
VGAVTYRKRVEWPPHVRAMLGEELRLAHEAARTAETAFKIRVYIAVEQGLTTQQIADDIGLSQATISRYRIDGEAAYQERQATTE